MKEIAVQGMTVSETIVILAGAAKPTVSISEVGPASIKNLADGKNIALDQHEFILTFTPPASHVMVSPVSIQSHKLNSTALKIQEGSSKVIRVDDESIPQAWSIALSSSPYTPSSGTIKIVVDDAGQVKVLAN